MKKCILGFIALALLFSGCPNGKQILFKEIPGAVMPHNCEEAKQDACQAFECMIDQCWCGSSTVPDSVLLEGSKVIESEQQAIELVQEFIQEEGSVFSEYSEVKNAVKVNTVFYNVFAFNEAGNEKVFTVAVDGSIIETQCGV